MNRYKILTAQSQAQVLGLSYVDLYNFPVDLNVLGLFEENEAKEMGAVPFYKDQKDLRIGTISPNHALLQEKIRELKKAGHTFELNFGLSILRPQQ